MSTSDIELRYIPVSSLYKNCGNYDKENENIE